MFVCCGAANTERIAVPLSGPGGKIAVLEISKTGRLPDGVIPALVHGTNIMDFCWDPFDNHRLAVGCDDGTVRLWRIPNNGLVEPTNEPETLLEAHPDKIYVMKFHPLAADILATASYDTTIRVWDLQTLQQRFCLTGHTDQIFCMSWSPCGTMLATVCKDGYIRVFKPRQTGEAVKQGKGPVGTRGARLVWALDGNFIVVIGFDK
jgi:coronin-7